MSTSNFSFNNGNIDFINLEYLDEIERERNYEFGFCECQVRRDSNRSI